MGKIISRKGGLGLAVVMAFIAALFGSLMTFAAPSQAYAAVPPVPDGYTAAWYIGVSFDKNDAEGTEYVAGATFRLEIPDLNFSDTWTTDGTSTSHFVYVPGRPEGDNASVHMVITEVTPPEGYGQMSPVTLRMNSQSRTEGAVPEGEPGAGTAYSWGEASWYSTHTHAYTGENQAELVYVRGENGWCTARIVAPGRVASSDISFNITAPDQSDVDVINNSDSTDVQSWTSDGTAETVTLEDDSSYTICVDDVRVGELDTDDGQVSFRKSFDPNDGTPVRELLLTSSDVAAGRAATGNISVNKEIDVPSSVDLTGLTYTFDFQAAAPVQGELSAYAVPAGVDIPTVTLTAANSTLATGSDSVRNLIGTVALPNANLFGHAGVYAFTVTETVTGANANDHWDNDQSVYKVRLYVMNDGNGGLMYSDGSDANQTPAMMFELIEDIDGNAAASNTKPSALAFKNIYDKTVPFEVAKSVAGEYANRAKKFGFAVALDFPDYVADNTTYAYTTSAGGSGSVTVSNGAATLSNVQLADGETLNFASLPVGTVYTVTELDARDGVNNYVPSATYTYSGVGAANSGYETHQNTVAAGTAGQQNYAVNSTSGAAQNLNTILGAGAGNRVDVLNTLSNPPSPTGIIVASIPDLLLVGIPASLIAVWMVYRNRREEDYGY